MPPEDYDYLEDEPNRCVACDAICWDHLCHVCRLEELEALRAAGVEAGRRRLRREGLLGALLGIFRFSGRKGGPPGAQPR